MNGSLVRMVVLGLAGLVLSAGLGSGAYLLTRDTIGLAVTELGASAPLVPTTPAQQRDRVAATVETRTESTESGDDPGSDTGADTVERSAPRTSTDDDSDSGRGRGRSGGGNSGRGGRDD